MEIERYWTFGIICLAYATALLWLVLHRRITLQASLTFLLFLAGLGGVSVVVASQPSVFDWLGFELPSNLLFSISIGVLGFLHLMALISISRLEQRSITLIQEVALMQETLERHQIQVRKLLEGQYAPGRDREKASSGGAQ